MTEEIKDKKYTLVTISDHPLASSGVGLQMRYIIDHLVKTGKFRILAIAGAIRHQDYRPQKFEKWGDDVVILPIDGYGNKDLMRQIIDSEKPDGIFFITDPRFYGWLWEMEAEIHQQCPLIYWHVWDNWPYPQYNEIAYKSTDFIGCINRLTHQFLAENGFEDRVEYVPHGVPEDDYKILPQSEIDIIRKNHLSEEGSVKDCFIMFYNSRNALRKRTGNALYAWKLFLDKLTDEEKAKCKFCMHTPPTDPEGQNLFSVCEALNIKEYVGFSTNKVENSVMNEFYNMADVTISTSSEEGFGLSMLESLMAGTPVVCTKTGGMQDQAIDWETGEVFGHCIEPDARSLIGSQTTPYIWSDHIDPQTVADCIYDLYQKKQKFGKDYKNQVAGEKARASALRRFHLPKIQEQWEAILVNQIEKFKNRPAKRSTVRMATL